MISHNEKVKQVFSCGKHNILLNSDYSTHIILQCVPDNKAGVYA